jgi:NitT/TauT family transport system substrate-binding protein
MRHRKWLQLFVLVILVTAACGGQDDSGGGSDGSTRRITVLLPNPSAVNVFNLCAAMGEGYLADEGLEARVEAVDGSGAVLQAMVAGQAEIGLPGPGPVLGAIAQGEDPVLFYNHFSQSLFGIVVPDESEYGSIEDLSGQTIGVGTAEGAEVSFARAIFTEAGLEEGPDYEFLPVGDGGQATAAFERGDIQAYSAAISDMAIIEARGLPLRELTPDEFLSYFGNGYAAMASTIEQDPDMIEGFSRAMAAGTEFAKDDKEATLEHCAEINPEEASDPELTDALYEAIVPRTEPLEENEVGFFPPEAWEAWQESMLESGELDGPVDDLESAYTNDFVDS